MKNNENEENSAPETKTITVTAWYTPQISVSNGPDNYQGLPGLILEVNDGDLSIFVVKLQSTPKNRLKFLSPKKGNKLHKKNTIKL